MCLTDKETEIVEKIKEKLPTMSDFNKGYLLGSVENMGNNADKKKDD